MEWWKKAGFGMFIHLGPYSNYGHGEWVMQIEKISKERYQDEIAAHFDPVNFNADEIVNLAKDAGMKYIVITAKHHDGFAMWDTKVKGFVDHTAKKIFSLYGFAPFARWGRDILMELKKACDGENIYFGLYYSILDWNHPSQDIYEYYSKMVSMDYRNAYISDMKEQLRELINMYSPDIMWFDGDWLCYDDIPDTINWWTKSDGIELYKFVKGLSPYIIVNERVARGFGLGDFLCPEEVVPDVPPDRPWETCQTMNGSWGYDERKEDSYQLAEVFIRERNKVRSMGGNYLLNIGPKGDGSVSDACKKVLCDLKVMMMD